jgi:methylated-DNA-[protein]-cysteine S-methyltransferase
MLATTTMTSTTCFTYVPTPIGRVLLQGNGGALTGLHLADHRRAPQPAAGALRDDDALATAARQVCEYFDGARRDFDLELAPSGTPFQVEVWLALADIPYGETISYAELARRVNRPGAARAVGAANGANPISIILPCHRVIGADGSLTGYGWGLDTKSWLLAHERADQPLFS